MEAHPDPERDVAGQARRGDRALAVDGGRGAVERVAERREEGVALGLDDDAAGGPRSRARSSVVVARDDRRPGGGSDGALEARRALDVREQERDGRAGRKVPSATPSASWQVAVSTRSSGLRGLSGRGRRRGLLADGPPRSRREPTRHRRRPRRRAARRIAARSAWSPFEVARPPAEPDRQLRHDAPGEVLQPIGPLVARRDDRRRQPLDVAVLVAPDRPGVVGGDHPAVDVAVRTALGPHDEDQAEVRELVVGQPDGPELVVDVLEPVGVDRRADPVADRRGADQGPGGGAPGVERQVGGQLRGHEIGRCRASPGSPARQPRVRILGRPPAERPGLRQPGEVLVGPRQVDPAHRRGQEVEQGLEDRRLAGALREPGHDQRQAGLEEDPGQRRQLGVEDAAAGSARRWTGAAARSAARSQARRSSIAAMMTGPVGSTVQNGRAWPSPIEAPLEIVPLTPDRWDDVAALFGEGGDPKTCWCMFWRLRSKDWSFTKAAETRDGVPRARRRRTATRRRDCSPTATGGRSAGSASRRARTTSG